MPRRRKNLKGKGVFSSINNFLKKYKVISSVSNIASLIPNPAVKAVSEVVKNIAGPLGYGKRRRMKGKGLIEPNYGSGRIKKHYSQKEKMRYVRSFL